MENIVFPAFLHVLQPIAQRAVLLVSMERVHAF